MIIRKYLFSETDQELKNRMIKLIRHTSIGDLRNEAEYFTDRFMTGDGSDYFSAIMSNEAKNHENVKNFIKKFGELLNDELQKQKGDINKVTALDLKQLRPKFNLFADNFYGLTVMMNDTEHARIYKQYFNFNPSTKKWEGTFYIEVFDHFGLDNKDLLKFQNYKITIKGFEIGDNLPVMDEGFEAWWLLQHTRYKKPFRTVMKFIVDLKLN